ncbi:hypothetical protein [Parasitella parasitica]|uniref:Tc1-like transposase DDE domain-containing protein n=1 Tax=Parasitella parasitica TaxID=35722 RepID=A0A0B7NBH1_9FUNG|nr:hypothetical protein [Parasitella parasitica]
MSPTTRNTTKKQTTSADSLNLPTAGIVKKRRSSGPHRKLPIHIKNLIVDKCLRKDSMRKSEVAKLYDVSWQTVDNIVEKYVQKGTVEPKKQGGSREKNIKIKDDQSQFIQEILDENCTLTLGRIKEKLFDRFPEMREYDLSISGLFRHIVEHIGFTLKKTKPVEEKRNDPTTIAKRNAYVENMQFDGVSYKTNCIFVDEAGFNANLIRGQGWSKKGESSIVKTKTKRAINVSILAAISYQGVESVQAKMVAGGTTAAIFCEFVKSVMASLDKNNAAPHNFVMDNARIHTAPIVKDLFQNSRHKLHLLPPYSPFLNAIEECFSKLKTLVKRKPGLTGEAFLKHISECSNEIARENCKAWVEYSIQFFSDCLNNKEIY